jgi:hypothetical protein
VCTGLWLSIRRLTAKLKRNKGTPSASNAVNRTELTEIAVELERPSFKQTG